LLEKNILHIPNTEQNPPHKPQQKHYEKMVIMHGSQKDGVSCGLFGDGDDLNGKRN